MASFLESAAVSRPWSPIEAALEYISWDPNEETRTAIKRMSERLLLHELSQLLSSRLQFGTAGLRGPMGAGYNRMNDLVILQTTQGLSRYIAHMDEDAKSKGVIIGYDHRSFGSLSSRGFARMTAAVFLSQGYKIYLLEDFVPTPFVAYGIKHCGCSAGIMVTASHNPMQDNGFKVYWSNGSQIVPPHDEGIAASIAENLQPWQSYDTSDDAVLNHRLASDVTSAVAEAYFEAISRLSERLSRPPSSYTPVKAVYTAMHGVGYRWAKQAFQVFRHPSLDAVPSQADPDPLFPTVKFPNPEEKGALDQSFMYADSVGATLIIANDPDADRLAVAERVVEQGPCVSQWYVFSGNELGSILGHWQIMRWKKSSDLPAALLASVVSSRMLKAIALKEGMLYYDTLTGFKWLGDKAISLRGSGTPVIFSYEEALGYCIGDVICDKDGISAAAVLYELAQNLRDDKGMTVRGYLQQLYATYGEFVSYNSYVVSHDKAVTERIFARLRGPDDLRTYWSQCAGQAVVSVHDVTTGYDSSAPDGCSTLPRTPDSHMIMFEFDNGVSVTLRTSGTEPKIKFYTEIAGAPGRPRSDVEAALHLFVDLLVDEMLQPQLNGLLRP